MKHRLFVGCLFALLVMGWSDASFSAVTASDHSAVGAVVTNPWLVDGDRLTLATLTNGSSFWITVHVTVFDAAWQPINFDCKLSPMETTYFVFEAHSVGSKLTSECSDPISGNLNIVQTRFVPGERDGFVVFHHTLVPGATTPQNVLIGDFVVIDFDQGYAFSANAWHVQALAGSTDQNLIFDGTEFAQLPKVLAGSFIAPDDDITADLILYTLNGALGWPAEVKLGGIVYDDDEQALSNVHEYDCFTVVSLIDVFGLSVDRRNGPGGFPYFVGHVSLFALFAPGGYAGATAPPGAVASSLGWIVQTMADIGDLNDNQPLGHQPNFGNVSSGQSAWARQLLTTQDSIPNRLDADPRGGA